MTTVVCWLWRQKGYRSTFDWSHVSTLFSMVRRNYSEPFRAVCVTNLPGGCEGVETVPDTEDFADVASPHGSANPSCYRRLRLFRPDIGAVLGERIVSLDLDCVITGDVTPLWSRSEDFVIWKDPGRRGGYCGSMLLLTDGARPQVWERFHAMTSPQQALIAGNFGSDQGWISHVLGPKEAVWTPADGVYSFRYHVAPAGSLPADARLVFCHGSNADPWLPHMRRLEWVDTHYR